MQNLTEVKREFDARGFAKLEALLDPARLAELEGELALYHERIVPTLPPNDIVWEKPITPGGPRAIRNLWRMHEYSPYFDVFSRDPKFLEIASAMVNGTAEVWGVEVFAKPARVGSAVPYHQDNAYFNLIPADAFSLWIAIDRSDVDNGCVYYGAGTHRQRRPHKASNVPGNSLGLAESPAPGTIEEVPAVLKPGDAMMHHCEVLHRSEPNRSERPRRGMVIVYKGTHVKIDPEGQKEYTRILSAQREAMKVQQNA